MMRSSAMLAFWLFWAGPALAEDFSMLIQRLAMENIGKALCTPTENCDPATESELENPPFSNRFASVIVTNAVFSVMAQNCEIDYRTQVFLPFTSKLRQSGNYSERDMALVGLMHGATMGFTSDRPEYRCTEQTKDRLHSAGLN